MRFRLSKSVLICALLLGANTARSQWTVLHPSFLNPAGAGACIFISKDTGFIWGNAGLAITQDGGNSWVVNVAIPDTGDQISFPNYNDGWLWTKNVTPAYFFRTTNHGISWEKDSNTLVSRPPVDFGAGAFFKDSLNAWYGAFDLSIFHTTDGAKTWRTQYLDDRFTDWTIQYISFCNDSLGIALAGPHDLYILYTTDGGAVWHNLSNGLDPFLQDSPSGLVYTDPRHAWMSTVFNGLYRSTDSGKTWSGIAIPGSGFGIVAISFTDSNHGIVVKHPQYFMDSNNIIIDSIHDVVAYTSDGGQTWDTTLFHDALRYASFPDTTTAYVCSYYNLYRLSTANLAVRQIPPPTINARIETDAGNLFIVMPQNISGRVRIMDELGRVLEERALPPGARYNLSLDSRVRGNDIKAFRFAEVESGGRIQVFKILQ